MFNLSELFGITSDVFVTPDLATVILSWKHNQTHPV